MNPKLTLIAGLFFLLPFSVKAQTSEGRVFELTSTVKFHLHSTDQAQLIGNERYIQMGFEGNTSDVSELIGYLDRFIVNDIDMTTQVTPTITEGVVSYYKFFLNPLYDANNFQKMMEMLQVEKYFVNGAEKQVNTFSNTVLAFVKSKNQ